MSQQASNEHYADEAELAMDLAVAVAEEVADLFAAGADIVQIDEPWLQSRAEKAREFALPCSTARCATPPGRPRCTCFGYAAVVHDKPGGYPFLAELAGCAADILMIERPSRGSVSLEPIAHKTVIVGVLDLADDAAETPEQVAERIEAALEAVPAERLQVGPDCGMKYLSLEARRRRSCARSWRARGSCASGSSKPARGRARSAPRPVTSSRTRASASRMTASRSSVSARNGWNSRARWPSVRDRARRARVSRSAGGQRRVGVPSPPQRGEVREVVVGVDQLPSERQHRHVAGHDARPPASSG